jgi:hypothetical protein
MKENGYILLLDSHTSDLNIRLTNIDVSLFFPLHLFVILGSSGINFSLHDKKLYNILTNKWILWNVFIHLLKIPLRPYNEKKFEVYYFRGERRTSSKCLIYFHCHTVTKKTPANLWDEMTIAFIILSLDQARLIFVTKRWKLQEVIGSICVLRVLSSYSIGDPGG